MKLGDYGIEIGRLGDYSEGEKEKGEKKGTLVLREAGRGSGLGL